MKRAASLEMISGLAVLLLLTWVSRSIGYIGLVGTPTELDFFIQESFRGDEVDDRDFKYLNEQFLNILSFRHLSSANDIWTTSPSGYRLSLGSVMSDEFFLDHEAKVDVNLEAHTTLHYRFVQTEDYDSRYIRNLVGLSYRPFSPIRLYGFTQLNGLKDDIDVGGGLLVTVPPVTLNLGVVFPNAFLNLKSQSGERFAGQAFGLGLVVTAPVTDRWTVAVRIFQNFPLELAIPAEALTFQFRRFVYGARLSYRLNAQSSLRWGLDGEDTEKERVFAPPRSQGSAHLTRFALRSTLVYSRLWPDGSLLDAGVFVHRFYEPTRFPLNPARTRLVERTEILFFGQLSWHLWKGLFVVPGLFAGPVRAIERRPDAARPDSGGDSVQAKVSLAISYHFSARAQLRLQPTFDIDQGRFGGAGATFIAAF